MGDPASGQRLGRMAALAFALCFPTAMTWLYMIAVAQPDVPEGGNPALKLAYVTAKTLQFSFPVFAVFFLEGRWPRPGVPSFAGLRLGLGFGLLVAVAMFALYFGFLQGTPIFKDTPALLRAKVREFGMDSPVLFVVLGAFISLIHSLMEEYYWRWFVFGQMERLMPLTPAILVSSLGFMCHHVVVLSVYFPDYFWSANVPFSLGVAVGGGVWAWLYHRTGSIYAPWLSHLIVDTAIIVIGYTMLFRTSS